MSELKDKIYPLVYLVFLLIAIYVVYRAFTLGFEKGRYTGRYEPLAEETAAQAAKKPPADLRKLRLVTPEQVDQGRELFQINCATCHGPTGTGDGPKAVGLNPPPRNYHTEKFKFGASPLQIFNTLTKGSPGTSMASFDFLPAEERMALAHYVRTFVSDPPDDPQELVDALPASEGGAPAGQAAAADTAAGAAAKPAPTAEIPVDFAVRRLIQEHALSPVPAAGTAIEGPYAVYCAGCHGSRGEGSVVARNFPTVGMVYLQAVPLARADKRITESLASFTAFTAAGMPGLDRHAFARLSPAEVEQLYRAVKAIQSGGE
ncbi:MAG: cytochrome c [Candidatus Glassbacteria bacterium]